MKSFNNSENINSKNDINNFTWINPEKFEELISSNEYTIIDIRNPEELEATWYIKWSLNIVYYYPWFLDEIKKLDRNKKYLIYCNSWNRTTHTLEIMKYLWFKEAYHLSWWIISWLENNKSVTYCNVSNIC